MKTRQSGQSMTEFAVAGAALALLLMGTLALAGYQEVDRRLVSGARQMAWTREWAPEAEPLAQARRMHRELLADAAVREPSGRRLFVTAEDTTLSAGALAATGVAGTAAQLMRGPLRTASGFLGAGFDLASADLLQGIVGARIRPLPGLSPFNELDLQLQAPFALLGDAWHAAGHEHVRQRAAGLVPTQALQAMNLIWQPLAIPLGLLEPSLRQLCLGLIEPDRLPEHRLGPGVTPSPGDCP